MSEALTIVPHHAAEDEEPHRGGATAPYSSNNVISSSATAPAAVAANSAALGEVMGLMKSTRTVPVTTYLTPYAVVQRRLLNYQREAHFMPALQKYVVQVGAMME